MELCSALSERHVHSATVAYGQERSFRYKPQSSEFPGYHLYYPSSRKPSRHSRSYCKR